MRFRRAKVIMIQKGDNIIQECEASQSNMIFVGTLACLSTFLIARPCNLASERPNFTDGCVPWRMKIKVIVGVGGCAISRLRHKWPDYPEIRIRLHLA